MSNTNTVSTPPGRGPSGRTMTLDFQIVTTVKTELSRRLPSDLVTLVLEFANWANTELKRAWLEEYSRFAKLIPEFYRPDSYFNILATAHNLRERNRLIHPRLHRGPGEPNDVRNLRFSLEAPQGMAQIEPDYASCLHPTTIYGGGGTATILSWRDAWLAHFLRNRTDNSNGVSHPFVVRKQKRKRAAKKERDIHLFIMAVSVAIGLGLGLATPYCTI